MNIDLTRLFSRIDKEVSVDEIYSFTELEGTGVTSIDNVSIKGYIKLNALSEPYLNLDIEGVMVIPCAITLKPVEYPFSIKIEGDLEEIADDNPEKYINSKNSLDILPIIWENILMEIKNVCNPRLDLLPCVGGDVSAARARFDYSLPGLVVASLFFSDKLGSIHAQNGRNHLRHALPI